MLDGIDKNRLAQEGVDYLVEQNIHLKNKLAHLISENSIQKEKLKKFIKSVKEILASNKKLLSSSV